jgi:hypothetical protein
MVKKLGAIIVLATFVSLVPAIAVAGAPVGAPGPGGLPPLDQSLMAFKEQGVWYFPCVAPAYLCRIPPHYATYGPPPPVCPPPPMAYYPPPKLMKPKMMK